MAEVNRPNLYHQLRNDIVLTDILLDVGHGYLHDMIDFENSDFKTLKGMDKNILQPFAIYRRIKSQKYSLELHQYFKNRFHLVKIDFKDYDFKENTYSCIICNKVLHFYPDEEKRTFLNIFHRAIQPNGLLFIKLNHNKNQDNTDLLQMTEIKSNVFQNKLKSSDIRYLVEPNDFLHFIRSKYSIIERHTITDDKTISFVIRKEK